MTDGLISRQKAIDAIVGILTHGQAMEAERRIKALPSVDAVPVVPELAPAVEDLKAMYAIAKDQMWIRNPVLWALYQVWQKHESMEG